MCLTHGLGAPAHPAHGTDMLPTRAPSAPRSEGGFFKALMTFPKDYPNLPPKLQIKSEFWHPNGVCVGCVRIGGLLPCRDCILPTCLR